MQLDDIRILLDEVDENLLKEYLRRRQLSDEVAAYKLATGRPVLDRVRERQKLALARGSVDDAKLADDAAALMANIMTLSRKVQYETLVQAGRTIATPPTPISGLVRKDTRIAYQGERGGYGYLAMKQYFGDYGEHIAMEHFMDVIDAVLAGDVDCGILPIENSTAGEVTQVYDLLHEKPVYIVDEIRFPIRHALLGLPGASLSNVSTVYSHPQALMQCSHYLQQHDEWLRISLTNTAVSARKVAEDEDVTQVAIGSKAAAETFGLRVLEEGISDITGNTTKFILIQAFPHRLPNADHIRIAFRAPHESGSLYELLSHIKYNGLNMTKIFSRPSPQRLWDYLFFVELEGSWEDPRVQTALYGISEEAIDFRFLGTYPATEYELS